MKSLNFVEAFHVAVLEEKPAKRVTNKTQRQTIPLMAGYSSSHVLEKTAQDGTTIAKRLLALEVPSQGCLCYCTAKFEVGQEPCV